MIICRLFGEHEIHDNNLKAVEQSGSRGIKVNYDYIDKSKCFRSSCYLYMEGVKPDPKKVDAMK